MSVCCECCVLSGRGLCDGLITRPEESYRLWRVICVISKNLVNEVANSPRWAAASCEKKEFDLDGSSLGSIHLCIRHV
jgi:hypothetical protein